MIFYEIIDSKQKNCIGCILNSIDENEYEIILKNIGTEYVHQSLKIIDKKTQQILHKDSTAEYLCYLQVLNPRCPWKSPKTFCFFSSSETIKILSQKEALLKIL